jgi:hypothetical protein
MALNCLNTSLEDCYCLSGSTPGVWPTMLQEHVKVHLSPYNRKGDYIYHLAYYMSLVRCRAEQVPPFTKFLYLVATTDGSQCPPTPSCIECGAPGRRTSSPASPTTCACARMRQAIHARGNFDVFSATTKHHGFTLGMDDLLCLPPYFATCLE